MHDRRMVMPFTFEDWGMGRKSFGTESRFHFGLSCLRDIQEDRSNKQLNRYV